MNSVNMGTVWDRATEFLGDNIAAVTPIALAALFLPASINDAIAPLGANNPGMQLGINVAGLVLAIVSIFGELAIIAMAVDAARTAGDGARSAAEQVLMALLTSLAVLALVLLGLLPLIGLVAAAGTDMKVFATNDQAAIAQALSGMPSGIGWAIAVYSLLWVVGIVWISARFVLALPALVDERRGFGALARSWQLTRGLALKIVGVLVLYIIVSSVAALAAKTVFGGVLGLVAGGNAAGSFAAIVTSIAVGAVGTAFSVLQAAFVGKLFLAARDRTQEATGHS
ncbi:MAG: glycerophosphoryl diester phosphodiesterase membrane domain-containing protein [Sphingomonas sp.]|nr:glycerophosphoryl diester phosphodiesterase membrane domain-containing protein [Sphingomonas sp.]